MKKKIYNLRDNKQILTPELRIKLQKEYFSADKKKKIKLLHFWQNIFVTSNLPIIPPTYINPFYHAPTGLWPSIPNSIVMINTNMNNTNIVLATDVTQQNNAAISFEIPVPLGDAITTGYAGMGIRNSNQNFPQAAPGNGFIPNIAIGGFVGIAIGIHPNQNLAQRRFTDTLLIVTSTNSLLTVLPAVPSQNATFTLRESPTGTWAWNIYDPSVPAFNNKDYSTIAIVPPFVPGIRSPVVYLGQQGGAGLYVPSFSMIVVGQP